MERRTSRPGLLPTRVSDLGALSHVIRALHAGRGQATFLVGAAGLGKSTLLRALGEDARDAASVVVAAGHPRETDLPLGVARQVLRRLGGDLAGIIDGAAPSTARAQAWVSVTEAVMAAADRRPVVLVLDDLHWADPDSLGLVGYLVARLADVPVAVVGALRPWPEPAARLVDELVARDLATTRSLAPLAPADIDRLIDGLCDEPPSGPVRDHLRHVAGGNPFLITCAVAHLRAGGEGVSAQATLDVHLPLPAVFPHLPADALECARAAAVLGPVFRPALVGAVADLDDDRAAAGLDVLFRAGVLRHVAPDRAAFTHALVADAVYGDQPPRARARRHERALRCLARLDEVELAAVHAAPADLVGDPEAINVLERAGRRSLAKGAPRSAVHHLRTALQLAGDAPSATHLLLGDALAGAGQSLAAADAYRRAVDAPDIDVAGRVRARQSLARSLAYAGDLPSAGRASDDALEAARAAGPDHVTSVLVDRLHVLWQVHGPRRAREELDRHDSGAGAPAATRGAADLAATGVYVRFLAAADPAARHVLAEALEDRDPTMLELQSPFTPVLTLASVARYVDDLDLDAALIARGRQLAVEHGLVHLGLAIEMSLADNLIRRGVPTEALDLLRTVEREVEVEPLMREVVVLCRATALVQLGRHDEATDAMSTHTDGWLMWQSRLAVTHLESAIHASAGRMTAASAGFRHTEALAGDLGVEVPAATPWASGAVEAHLAVGALADVERVCRWLEDRAEQLPGGWTPMVAAWGRAGLAAARGDDLAAERWYTTALEVDTPQVLERARVLVHAGRWHRRSGRPRRARPLLAEAVAVYEAAGAQRPCEAALTELRVAGGRRRTRPRPPDELTQQEHRVAVLAGRGHTTREIADTLVLSPKTIESHLTRAYRKLGVRSKRELRDRVLQPPPT